MGTFYDYWLTYRHQGMRSVWANLLERYWFDWQHGTDTGLPLARQDFSTQPPHFQHGLSYASSWTSEVEAIFQRLHALLGLSFVHWSFVDIGCGKGKVILQWRRACQRARIEQTIIGIDYYEPLIQIARSNHRKMFGDPGVFVVCDASHYDYRAAGERLIAYLYNPFDDALLARVLDRLAEQPTILVYTNPNYRELPLRYGFRVVHHKPKAFHVNQETLIFSNVHSG